MALEFPDCRVPEDESKPAARTVPAILKSLFDFGLGKRGADASETSALPQVDLQGEVKSLHDGEEASRSYPT